MLWVLTRGCRGLNLCGMSSTLSANSPSDLVLGGRYINCMTSREVTLIAIHSDELVRVIPAMAPDELSAFDLATFCILARN